MLRRAASGHIETTQFSKFAAASRIARAVISGWPEAPSSPLQGGAGLLAAGAACACAEVAGRWGDGAFRLPFESEPVKMLSKRLKGPSLDCAHASPDNSNAATTMAAPVRLLANCFVRRVNVRLRAARAYPASGGLVAVSNRLTKGEILMVEILLSDGGKETRALQLARSALSPLVGESWRGVSRTPASAAYPS